MIKLAFATLAISVGLLVLERHEEPLSWRSTESIKACKDREGVYMIHNVSTTKTYAMCIDGSTHRIKE